MKPAQSKTKTISLGEDSYLCRFQSRRGFFCVPMNNLKMLRIGIINRIQNITYAGQFWKWKCLFEFLAEVNQALEKQ